MAESEKARLYKEIVQKTDDQTLLEQMRLYGFWPESENIPEETPEEKAERAKIQKELEKLQKQSFDVGNPQKALAEERKRRWEESKKRRSELKKQKVIEKQQRFEAWLENKGGNVVHLGLGVSYGLQQATSDVAKLNERGLPVMHTGIDLAARLGIKLSALRWLTYHRRGATIVHYHRYSIAKKTGGLRYISAPKPALAHCQRWILDNILRHISSSVNAHGFLPERSIVSNATPHVGKEVVINIDLKDFFPSITFRRTKGLFQGFGYSDHVATVLALLCTEPPRLGTEVDGKIYYVSLGQRVLPQGACTSPGITNALCWRLDHRLAGLAKKHDFTFTRYADDLTFSGNNAKGIGRLMKSIRSILEQEGFAEHPTKTRVMRRANRQEVTGLTVNDRPTVSRKEIRRLRAILHNVAKHGLESQNREGHPNFAEYLRGKVEFICMVDPDQSARLRRALQKALG